MEINSSHYWMIEKPLFSQSSLFGEAVLEFTSEMRRKVQLAFFKEKRKEKTPTYSLNLH